MIAEDPATTLRPRGKELKRTAETLTKKLLTTNPTPATMYFRLVATWKKQKKENDFQVAQVRSLLLAGHSS